MNKPTKSIIEAERFLNMSLANVKVSAAILKGIVEEGRLLIKAEDKHRMDDLAGEVYAAAYGIQINIGKFGKIGARIDAMAVK